MKAIENVDSSSVEIIIENEQDKMNIDEITAVIRNTVLSCLSYESFKIPCEIDITLSDNEAIRQINKQYRSIDKATDVLSFPLVDMQEGKILSSAGDTDIETGLLLLGDIIVSLEKAKQQAEEYEHSFIREVSFLVSHGVFHLLGYDHQDSTQEKNMFGRQEAVLEKLGFIRQ